MYLPCFVFPYQCVPGLWYTPEAVFTQTMPEWSAGGACWAVGGFGAAAGAVGLLTGVAAGAAFVDFAGAGVAAAGASAVFFFFSFVAVLESLWL